MTTYNTQNPVPSVDVRDLYDNAQNLDNLSLGSAPSYPDRLGVPRKSWKGMEADFAAFLAASGFELPVLVYVDSSPLVVDRPTQLIERDGILYSVKPSESFPATLTGTWAADQLRVVVRTDQDLRQDLASHVDPSKGAGLVGYGYDLTYPAGTLGGAFNDLLGDNGAYAVGFIRQNLSAQISTAGQMLSASSEVNPWEYASLIVDKPNPEAPSTWDWTPALQAAINAAQSFGVGVYISPGSYITGVLTLVPNVGIRGAGQINTVLRAKADGQAIIRYAAVDSIKFGFSISDIGFASNGKTGCTAIRLNGGTSDIRISRVNIENVSVTGTFAQGVSLRFCANTTIKNMFTSEVVDAIYIDQCADTDILSAKLQNGSGYGVYINGGAGAFDEGVRLVSVSTNGQAFGLGINGQDWGCATACSFSTCLSGGLVMVGSTNWKFSACEFAPAAGALNSAASISDTCSDIVFSGCHFILGSFGIALRGNRNTVVGCSFKANSNTDIFINSFNSVISGNVCDSPNAASIIETATANYNLINGNISNGAQTKNGANSVLVNEIIY